MNSFTYHYQEMEQRVRRFDSECEMAIRHIRHLNDQAKSFLDQLSDDPRELKNRFLQCMKQLDQFMYHITEFNLNTSNLEITVSIPNAHKNPPTPKSNRQSEVRPRSNTWRSAETKDSRTEQPTQTLTNENWRVNRSRSSDSSRSRSNKKKEINGNTEAIETDTGDLPQDVFLHRKADGCQPLSLPPQPKLDPATVSKATIITVNGAQLWMVMDNDFFTNFVQEMTEYYTNQKTNQDYIPEDICAYYDEAETKCFLRAIYINSEDKQEVFLVDTGEFQPAIQSRLRPLHPRFCSTPPMAHLCCLADVDQTEDEILEDRQTEFLKQYLGQTFKIKFKLDAPEEDPSKPVYLFLDDGKSVNELLVQALDSSKPKLKKTLLNNTTDENQNISIPIEAKHELIDDENEIEAKHEVIEDENEIEAKHIVIEDENERIKEMNSIQGAEKIIDIDDELDYSEYPEYENAVEAVTGYSNRDEMDICKHYIGGEGCFKGRRCKKRHVMIHPEGWTLDRVSVTVKCRPAALPAPGTCRKVKVTHVESTCRLYVHFEQPEEPMKLANLVDEMTRAAADSKSLQLEAAPGELVSAKFSDGRHYRARVIASGDRETEVMYIDFGNTAKVADTDLRLLEPRWLALPVQAVPCRLAGVSGIAPDVSDVSAAEVLKQLALDKIMEAHIIARDFDELSVKLLDSESFDIAEQLAAFTGLELKPYQIEEDSQRLCHLVPA